jgi:hypothetical protein
MLQALFVALRSGLRLADLIAMHTGGCAFLSKAQILKAGWP